VHGLKEARHEVERQACACNGCEREAVCVEQTGFAVEALAEVFGTVRAPELTRAGTM